MNGYKHKRSPRNGASSSTEPFILLITRTIGSIHHASYGDLADPQNCVLVNFSGVKGFLPSDMRKDTYGDLQGSPKPFPTRETHRQTFRTTKMFAWWQQMTGTIVHPAKHSSRNIR